MQNCGATPSSVRPLTTCPRHKPVWDRDAHSRRSLFPQSRWPVPSDKFLLQDKSLLRPLRGEHVLWQRLSGVWHRSGPAYQWFHPESRRSTGSVFVPWLRFSGRGWSRAQTEHTWGVRGCRRKRTQPWTLRFIVFILRFAWRQAKVAA